jgi:protein O-GlcNAc transferase
MSESDLQEAQRLHKGGQLAEAEKIYRRLLAENADDAMVNFLLGQLLHQVGKVPESAEKLSRAVELRPEFSEAHHQLGISRHTAGDIQGAVGSFKRALELRPRYALALNSMGIAYQTLGDYPKAIESFRAAVEIQPDLDVALSNLGSLLSAGGKVDESIELLTRALKIRPKFFGARNNLGTALKQAGRLDEAMAAFSEAIAIRPDYAEAFNNLGNALLDSGQAETALSYFRRAVGLQPNRAPWHSNLIAAMNYASVPPEIYRQELEKWNERYAAPLAARIRAHENERDPERRLRIGYVSPDFMGHPIGRFVLSLLANHDRERFEIFCYADVHWPDETTGRIRALADEWRVICGKPDAQVAKQIREDKIDVLIDLSLHTAGNRLLVFAQKPAPVQATYLAYPGTSGMKAMDYRVTDPHLDPPGGDESSYSEKSVRLPRTYWCYEPVQTPEPGALPGEGAGVITFASFNNFCKTSSEVWEVWRRVLREVPGSRLVLSSVFGAHRDRMRRDLAKDGVKPERLSFAPPTPTSEYFKQYQRVDIGLDPFPFNGGTTTCDALWMGVPVVTMRGGTAVGRAGVSLLSQVGLTELIADSPDQYVAAAKRLAEDMARLAQIRRELRGKMRGSPLMDSRQFARDVEEAFRWMWKQWCGGRMP